MRILYFSRDYTPHDHRFLSAIAGSGLQVGYLRLEQRRRPPEGRPLPTQVKEMRWAGGRGQASPLELPRLLPGLKRIVREYKPDLIHAGPLQTCAFLVALTGFRPLVSMSWGYDLLYDARRSRLWRWATRYTLRRSAAMVGDCATIRREAVQHGMDPNRIVTFPWGVDLRQFSPTPNGSHSERSWLRSQAGWGPETFVLLSTRSWEPIYGIEVLARAFVKAARNCPELCLIMLGGGSLAARLRQSFATGGMIERVYFAGQVEQAELVKYYRAADLYLSASHSDGTSISMLEALATGVPVLLSDIPGNREWITPGEEGWLFPDGDDQALAEAILEAVGARQRLPEMGKAARVLAEQRANWEVNSPQLFEAYRIALQPVTPSLQGKVG